MGCSVKKAEQVVNILKEKKIHISTAESCTGGMIAASIVDISGASDVFEEGYVTYSNRVKSKLLDVKEETIEKYTVVSSEVAKEMASGVAKASGAEITVSVTGYAGPYDADDGTPAGTVYIGTFYRGISDAKHYKFDGDRQAVRKQAVIQAFDDVLERLRED